MYLFLLQKEWQSSIVWRLLYLFWQENLQSTIVWVILSAEVSLFPGKSFFQLCVLSKYYNHFYRILAAIHYFNGTVQFSDVKIFSHPNLPTHFLSVYVKTPVPVKQTSYRSSYIFRVASIILKWAVTWSCYFFTEIFFSEHLVV